MPHIKLTSSAIEKLPIPNTGQILYRDTQLPGLCVRITRSGKRAFVIDKWDAAKGRPARITIGDVSALTCFQARQLGKKILGGLAGGINPTDQRREDKVRGVTLEQAFEDFLAARKNLAARTVYAYTRLIATCLYDLNTTPIVEISRDMVQNVHTRLGQSSESQANLALRLLRAILNFAGGRYEDAQGRALLMENPVRRLSATRAWYSTSRRETYIKPHQIPAWFDAVQSLPAERKVAGDYLTLLFLTGLRRGEAATLLWQHVDLNARTLTVLGTKNGSDHTLPLSDFLFALLAARRKLAINGFVFPGVRKSGYLLECRKTIELVELRSGVEFTLHDLRRSFATIVNALEPAPSYYTIKRLLNHRIQDVSAGYIGHDIEKLRGPMQQVTDSFLMSARA